MNVSLTDDQRAFARQAIMDGRYASEEDAVQEAMALWEERERTRAELLTAIHSAETSLAERGGRLIDQSSIRQLADEVKERGRTRLHREKRESNR